ncbi:unnamed protein product [Somion occarium]|uniref:Protein kinase domain-containing protein n=1 Tax=Somion occarium TaxID=3059160 RepID=A0ABP1CEK2_9APHY
MTREETQQTSKIQDFARESLLWLQLQHENVVHLLGIDVERFPGMPCMVLPWMESGNIRNYMEKKTFPVVQLNQWLREVAEGLTYLHDEQVVHGDLRGTNILMSEDGVAKLADFGLSVFAGERSKSFHSLRGGSERWMAPELLDPEAMNLISTRPTLASDVYSFGIVCVEIYTCEKPFHAHTNDNHVRKIVGAGGRPEKPSDPLKAIMDDDLFDLVCSCWQHQPSDRPPISTVLQQLRDRA